MGAFFTSLLSRFYTKNLNLVFIGLENSGKTTLLSVLANGHPIETVPTIGLVLKTLKKGNVTFHCWDIGGQASYREEWLRYTQQADVVAYVVDAADYGKVEEAGLELKKLLERGMNKPVLVLANKIDKKPHMAEDELVAKLGLESVEDVPWIVMPISAQKVTGVDSVVEWLCDMGH